jgi:hypothetical protein
MSKTAILIAILIACTAAFAGVAPTTQLQQPEQSKSMIVMRAHQAGAFGYLSMGPDPGGKTGDTVTPTTTTTSQPSSNGAGGGSSQSGGSSTAPSGAASTKTDPNTRPTSSSGTSKQ